VIGPGPDRSEQPEVLRFVTFVQRWRKIIDGGSKSAEGWAVEFEEEAKALLEKAGVKP
jgi:hypothetical protein